jgi:hypothetical protein
MFFVTKYPSHQRGKKGGEMALGNNMFDPRIQHPFSMVASDHQTPAIPTLSKQLLKI